METDKEVVSIPVDIVKEEQILVEEKAKKEEVNIVPDIKNFMVDKNSKE